MFSGTTKIIAFESVIFSSRRRHTRWNCDWSSDVCSSDLEVELIGILDADKEGFLRSETSLIQTMGRAARNVNGRVILYADQITGSLERAIGETDRRRAVQVAYNKEHGITPVTISKRIKDIVGDIED